MNLRKTLIYGAFLSLAMALYQVMFQPWWNSWLETQGRSVGIGEVALGFFIMWFVALLLSKLVTRRMK